MTRFNVEEHVTSIEGPYEGTVSYGGVDGKFDSIHLRILIPVIAQPPWKTGPVITPYVGNHKRAEVSLRGQAVDLTSLFTRLSTYSVQGGHIDFRVTVKTGLEFLPDVFAFNVRVLDTKTVLINVAPDGTRLSFSGDLYKVGEVPNGHY